MSREPLYSYEEPLAPGGGNMFLPVLLLALALGAVLGFQALNVSQQASTLQEERRKLAEAISQRELGVKQSAEVQEKLQVLAIDLIALAATDEKAKAIVEKYKIQRTGPAAAPTAAPAQP